MSTSGRLYSNGEDAFPVREEYDIPNLNPRKNPYAKKIKEETSMLPRNDLIPSNSEIDATEEDAFLEKEFDFHRAIKNPYVKEL